MNLGLYRWMAAVTCSATLSSAVSSCTGAPDEKGGTLPPLTPTARSSSIAASASVGSSQMETEEVRSVYLGFLKSYVRAQRVSPRLRATYLAKWLAEPRLTDTVKSLAYDEKHYIRTVGADRSHIIDIEQSGSRATVEDCLDRTHIYAVDSRTGNRINGSRGPGHFWVTTMLRKTSMGWRVYKAKHEARRCSY